MKLNLLFGAGSTIAAGMPSTSDITARLEQIREPGSKSFSKDESYFRKLKQLLMARGNFKDVNFELMLHALQVIQPLLPKAELFPIPDYFRPVLKAFVELTEEIERIENVGALSRGSIKKYCWLN